ncbi:MAG TPA: NAD(P)H-binding protein [Terracidiphilus sp.]|nr:NAD(P)H-binding protein [Terracidiphilus sp.]
MKVLIFGATGMVGQGALLECLRAPDVERVTTIVRSATGRTDAKLEEIAHGDLMNLTAIEDRLRGLDACFFCLGVSSAGMQEDAYARVTYGLTVAAGETLAALNPGMKFLFVSGAGTDSTEKGGAMWARVKGRAENALLRLPLDAYMFRPGVIEPKDGIRSKTKAYRVGYMLMKPVMPLLRLLAPNQIVSTREMGQAMLNVARRGFGKRILEARDIRAAAAMVPPAQQPGQRTGTW